ncbi:MAG: signal peptidase II [Clostridia bacterium]|nr:signal peptidase II [Clostridia bacterium]
MIYIFLFIAFLACDMWVKNWTLTVLKEVGSMEVLPKLLALTYAENKGAAFSMLSGARWFFVIAALAFVVALIVMYKKNHFVNWWSKLGAVMVAAGAIGNAIDRMRYGFVVDMFEFLFVKFAIFNVADVFITIGAVIFCLYIFVSEMDEQKKKKSEPDVIQVADTEEYTETAEAEAELKEDEVKTDE